MRAAGYVDIAVLTDEDGDDRAIAGPLATGVAPPIPLTPNGIGGTLHGSGGIGGEERWERA